MRRYQFVYENKNKCYCCIDLKKGDNMSIQCRFSRAIYYARKEMGITQAKAAEELNISVRWYQIIENGKCMPSTILTLKLIAFFGIDGKSLRKDFTEHDIIQINKKYD